MLHNIGPRSVMRSTHTSTHSVRPCHKLPRHFVSRHLACVGALATPCMPSSCSRCSHQILRHIQGRPWSVQGRQGCSSQCRANAAARQAHRPQNWQVISAVVALSMLLCNFHRSVFTILTPSVADTFLLDAAQVGVVQSSMLVGYLLGQIPAGTLSDRFGGDRVMVVCLLLWSVSLAGTGMSTTLPTLMATRAAFGLLSACAMPAVSAMASRHVPAAVKASTIASIYLFFSIGGVLGLLATPVLSAQSGWRAAMQTASMGGVAWAVLGWQLLRTHTHPSASPTSTAPEGAQEASRQPHALPGLGVARQGRLSQVAVLCWAHAVIGWGFFIFQSWIPLYLRHLNPGASLSSTGLLSAVPWLAAGVVGAISGNMADRLIAAGLPRLRVRRIMHSVSTLGCAACMLPLVLLPSVSPVLACLCLTAFNSCYAFSFGGFHAYIQDVAVQGQAGRLTGFTNSCGTVMGIIGNLATGWLVQATGSFSSVFLVTGALYLSSMAAFTLQLDGEEL